jgi:hypothetical protein
MAPSSSRATIAPPSLVGFRQARAAGDAQAVMALGRALVRKDPTNLPVLRGVARTQTELGLETKALESWAELHRADPADMEAAYHLGRSRLRAGEPLSDIVVQCLPQSNGLARKALSEALASGPEPSLADDQFRHIAICGTSFCGSTLLDRVLAGLPGVRSIGESHWLTKEHDGANYVSMDLGAPRSGRGPFCTVCGRACEALTPAFRTALAIDPSRWYAKIAHRLATPVLVSADKNLPKLVDNDPLLRFTGLVVFKSPLQAWASQLAKMPAGGSSGFQAAALERYAETWRGAYDGFLHGFEPRGGAVFLPFDAFAARPHAGLAALTEALGLEHDDSVLNRTRPGHAIGGNAGAMRRLRDADYGVNISELPTPAVPAEQAEWLARHRPVQETYLQLMKRRLAF